MSRSRHTGLVVGYLGGLGNLYVAAYLPFAGAIGTGRAASRANFVIVGLAPLVGFTVLVLGWGQERQADEPDVVARSLRSVRSRLDDVGRIMGKSDHTSIITSPDALLKSSRPLPFRVAVETAHLVG